jgi:hypothetical protein
MAFNQLVAGSNPARQRTARFAYREAQIEGAPEGVITHRAAPPPRALSCTPSLFSNAPKPLIWVLCVIWPADVHPAAELLRTDRVLRIGLLGTARVVEKRL